MFVQVSLLYSDRDITRLLMVVKLFQSEKGSCNEKIPA